MGWTWHRFFAATPDEIPTLQAKYRELKQKGEIGPDDLATFFTDEGKRIEQALNRKILEARQNVNRAKRRLQNTENPIGAVVAEWALKRAEAELERLLHYASEALDAR